MPLAISAAGLASLPAKTRALLYLPRPKSRTSRYYHKVEWRRGGVPIGWWRRLTRKALVIAAIRKPARWNAPKTFQFCTYLV
jgi:hypothetical protein